ncbi:peptidoglycan-binding domain-containing protein [Rhodanobacter glycinis]|uniref:peptidoglycan-binding domain-containing protein n=1 Tax=Rhodanobacter glycinis TaxID=582702 RepID=UPI001375CA3C|nr:peptidoglycan-binding domain-containing protein [Rhodanobacter glycinis]
MDQAAKYAKDHDLKFTSDTTQLRTDLLTHGDGERGRSSLTFIDTDTRNSINAWASSEDGQKWIHKNIDYPQIRQATQSAMDMLDKYGKNIPEDRRLETVAILAKTENQIPSQMAKFEKVLKNGGDYNDVLAEANEIKSHHRFYDGPKAAALAEQYKNAYKDPENAAALDRAHAKVGDANFDPSKSASDPDIKEALKAIGQGGRAHTPGSHSSLHQGSHGEKVTALQTDLAKLGFTDAHGRALHPDGDFGPSTKAAVEKFQHAHHMTADGIAGPKTLNALRMAVHPPQPTLADAEHPGNGMYLQALGAVHRLDAQQGRTPDQRSDNLAAALTVAAHGNGMSRVDHVVLSDDASRAFAVQGDINSLFKRYTDVNVGQAMGTPLAQSSVQWQHDIQQLAPAQAMSPMQQMQNSQMDQSVMQR